MASGQFSRCASHKHLHVDVHHEDGGYWAEIRELPGCFASGDNMPELMGSVEEAIALYLAPREVDGPPPVAVELAGFELAVESAEPLQGA